MKQPSEPLPNAISRAQTTDLRNFLRSKLRCGELKFLLGRRRLRLASSAPALRRRFVQPRLGNERAHAPAEAAETNLALAQRPNCVPAGTHSSLDAFDQRLVLNAHAAVDPPVEIARRLHLPAAVWMHVGDLTNQRFRRGHW